MFVRAKIEEGVNENALVVPQVGITHDQKGQPTALVVGDDNKVVLRQLVTSGTYGPNWVVESGLKPGDRVIVQGTDKAKPACRSRPWPRNFPLHPPPAQPLKVRRPPAAARRRVNLPPLHRARNNREPATWQSSSLIARFLHG